MRVRFYDTVPGGGERVERDVSRNVDVYLIWK